MERSEDTVPENSTQSITAVRVAVVMQKMASLYALKPFPLEIMKMRSVVHEIVNHVTEGKSCKGPGRNSLILQNEVKKPIDDRCQGKIDGRWHDQPKRIVRIIVMHTMGNMKKLLAQSACESVVEYDSMNEVF